MAEVEQGEIQAYIQKSGIKYESSSLGVWYAITKQGNGKSIGKQNIILIEYQIETIHGDTIYLYTKNAKRELKVGKMEKERGFDNALTLLKEGCEATIIVPSNLAFGILGDRDRIPPRATLIYRIKDIKIKQ